MPIFVICAGTQVVLGGIGGRPLTVNEARLRGGRGDAPADPLLDNRGVRCNTETRIAFGLAMRNRQPETKGTMSAG